MAKPYVLLILLICVACSKNASVEGEKYGATITLTDTTPVAQILSAPEQYLGKRVLVRGEVLEVCAKAGCWMEIAGDQPDQKIKVKVNDGEIVFPMTAQGKTAQVEGEVYEINLTHEEAIGWMAHVAEEKGQPFDSTSVTGPMTLYQIKGLAAVIEN